MRPAAQIGCGKALILFDGWCRDREDGSRPGQRDHLIIPEGYDRLNWPNKKPSASGHIGWWLSERAWMDTEGLRRKTAETVGVDGDFVEGYQAIDQRNVNRLPRTE